MDPNRIIHRYLTAASSVMTWPKLKGHLIKLTKPVSVSKGKPGRKKVKFDKGVTFVMTGGVVKGTLLESHLFEATLEGDHYWIQSNIHPFGMYPHKFMTKGGKELGPEFFAQ
jgi:hypothetical protein